MHERVSAAEGRKAWNQKDKATLIVMRENGKSYPKIARELGRSISSVEQKGAELIKKGAAPSDVRGKVIEDLVAHFWSRVDMSGGPNSCWPWTGALYGESLYGAVNIDLGDGARTRGAHIAAFVLSGGEITSDTPHVLHSCDNKPCCNPKHLSAGTHSRNMKEAFARGLSKPQPKCGEDSHFSKLTVRDVGDIRMKAASGISRKALAAEYRLSKSGMDHIVSGRHWKHVQ